MTPQNPEKGTTPPNPRRWMIWDRRNETLPRAQLQRLQLERLQMKVREAYGRVPFYRLAMRERGLTPDAIRSLADLRRLPFTTKADYRDNYPLGLAGVPLTEIVRVHISSGTTGKPTMAAYTREDIELWSELMARVLISGGVTQNDVLLNAHAYGLFTGGLGFHYGGEKLGVTVLPASAGNIKRQVMLIQDLRVTAICCTPSYALLLAENAEEAGVDLRSLALRVGFFGAEPWSEQMRSELETRLGLQALDIYGLCEAIGPGVASECPEQNGLHINEDHFLVEVIDPATGEVLPDGSQGELVLTTLTRQASPALRFRTRDITRLHREPCPCGRTLARMEKVTGRTDDMLSVQGVNVFPSQIESVLLDVEGVEPHYLIVVDHQRGVDELEVWVEVSEEVFSDEVRRLERLERAVRQELEAVLGFTARVRLVEPRTLERAEGKSIRVIDKRKGNGLP